MKHFFTGLLDLFYPLFKKIMPLETYRYAACGGINTAVGLMAYFLSYRFLFTESVVEVLFFVFKPHVAALIVSALLSFCLGFVMNKFIVFTGSALRGRIQLIRYLLTFLFNILLNYAMLKWLVEYLKWDAVYGQLTTTTIVVFVGYISQKYFSFRNA
jgi:putative flippase GtrA